MLAEFITMLDEARSEIGEGVVLSLEVVDRTIRFRATRINEDEEFEEYGVGVTKDTLHNAKGIDVMPRVTRYLKRRMRGETPDLDDGLQIPIVREMEFVNRKSNDEVISINGTYGEWLNKQ